MEICGIKSKTALVVGLGGLGGYVAEELARAGVGKLLLFDGDVFSESNMNRQLLATYNNIGKPKAETYAEMVAAISDAKTEFFNEYLTAENADAIDKADVVLDCVDTVKARLFLADECAKRKKILIHGAVEGLCGQIAVCTPEGGLIKRLFKDAREEHHSTTGFAAATVASIQVNFAVKTLCGMAEKLADKTVYIDMDTMEIEILE